MAIYHTRSKRKKSGGRTRRNHKHKAREQGREFIGSRIGEEDVRKKIDVRGGNEKTRVRRAQTANVTDSAANETTPATIEDVVEHPNPEFVRRNILTKGAIIETTEGRARVTSRPNQSGIVNAVLVE